jgi:hypothetical protein
MTGQQEGPLVPENGPHDSCTSNVGSPGSSRLEASDGQAARPAARHSPPNKSHARLHSAQLEQCGCHWVPLDPFPIRGDPALKGSTLISTHNEEQSKGGLLKVLNTNSKHSSHEGSPHHHPLMPCV